MKSWLKDGIFGILIGIFLAFIFKFVMITLANLDCIIQSENPMCGLVPALILIYGFPIIIILATIIGIIIGLKKNKK